MALIELNVSGRKGLFFLPSFLLLPFEKYQYNTFQLIYRSNISTLIPPLGLKKVPRAREMEILD